MLTDGQKAKKQVKKLCVSLKSIIFAVVRQLLPLRTARREACQSKNFFILKFLNFIVFHEVSYRHTELRESSQRRLRTTLKKINTGKIKPINIFIIK